MPGFHTADSRIAPDDGGDEHQIDRAVDPDRLGRCGHFGFGLFAQEPIDDQEEGKHARRDDDGLQPQMPRGPEEVDPAQEADEQRRVAERTERAAHIGDQDDEEHDHMRAVAPAFVRADHRPDQDHGGAGGSDDAGDAGAESQGSPH